MGIKLGAWSQPEGSRDKAGRRLTPSRGHARDSNVNLSLGQAEGRAAGPFVFAQTKAVRPLSVGRLCPYYSFSLSTLCDILLRNMTTNFRCRGSADQSGFSRFRKCDAVRLPRRTRYWITFSASIEP